MVRFDYHTAQIQGTRPRQEDSCGIHYDGGTLSAVLADGLGGYRCGDIAAELTVDQVLEELQHAVSDDPRRPPAVNLRAAARKAHDAVNHYRQTHPECGRMAATLIAVSIDDTTGLLHYLAAGDSLLLGLTSWGVADLHRQQRTSGMVTCAVGYTLEEMECTDEGILLQPGDRFLLASDGIETLERPAIARLLRQAPDARSAVESLLAAIEAQASPKQDNTTIIALFVGREGA